MIYVNVKYQMCLAW